MRARHIALVGTGGSSGETLALVEAAIRRQYPASSFIFIDTQPFNLRTRGRTRYPGNGDVRVLSPETCRIRTYTGSQTTNLMMNGGPVAYRRLIRHSASALGKRPDVMVLCHDRMYVETALLHAAKAMGARTVLLQEGPFCAVGASQAQGTLLRAKAALAPLVNRSGLVPAIPDYGMAGHDLILAASPAYRDRWIAAGVPPGSVRVSGVPRFDRLLAIAKSRRAGSRDLSGLAPFRLLYLTQPFAAHGKVSEHAARAALDVMIEGLNTACRAMPLEFVIRSHPRSSGEDVAHLRAGLQFAPITDDGSSSIEHAISAATATIGHYSTGLLESLMLGVPAICVPVQESGFAERSEAAKQAWLTTTGIPVAHTGAELMAALEKIGRGSASAQVDWPRLEEETGPVSGLASEAAAREILNIAGLTTA